VAVVPAYNEEDSIAKVILQTKRYVDAIIVCDDGSTDMTFKIAEALGVTVVQHDENRGKGEAMKSLFGEIMALDPDVIVALDGDGQHNPDEIPMLVKPIEKGVSDVVVGSRYVGGIKPSAPLYRRLGLRFINFLYKRAGVHTKDTQSGFRAYSQKAFQYLIRCDANGYGIEGEQLFLATRNGLRVMEVPVNIRYAGLGQTSKKAPILQGVDTILTLLRLVVEDRPLKYLGLPGVILALAGTISGLYLLGIFNASQHFSLPVAILTVGMLTTGLLSMVTGIILQGFKKLNARLNKFERKKDGI
jgi:glycosyltransferase involved in cell wall biosynthesis